MVRRWWRRRKLRKLEREVALLWARIEAHERNGVGEKEYGGMGFHSVSTTCRRLREQIAYKRVQIDVLLARSDRHVPPARVLEE